MSVRWKLLLPLLFVLGGFLLSPTVQAKPEVETDSEEYVPSGFSHKAPKEQKFFIFGYGEMHYNNIDNADDILDFHRLVLGWGYDFTDRIRLRVELDFEHGFAEPELEYAYVDFDILPQINVRAGSILIPIGTMNQYHEPANFYSVERPDIYNRIIPTSWPEGGAGIFGELVDGLTYQLYVHTSLDFNQGAFGGTGFGGGSGLRGGRGKVSEASANNIAGSMRLQYTGMKGLRIGASGFLGNTAQGDPRVSGGLLKLIEGDVKYSIEGFELEGVVAAAFLSDAGEINTAQLADGNITAVNAGIGSRLFGYMFEGAYHVFHHVWKDAPVDLIAFARYEKTDTQDALPVGFTKNGANDRTVITTGLSFKPIHNVAIKFDYQFRDNAIGTANDQFNAGIAFNY